MLTILAFGEQSVVSIVIAFFVLLGTVVTAVGALGAAYFARSTNREVKYPRAQRADTSTDGTLAERLDARFERIEYRFDRIEERQSRVEARVQRNTARIADTGRRVSEVSDVVNNMRAALPDLIRDWNGGLDDGVEEPEVWGHVQQQPEP